MSAAELLSSLDYIGAVLRSDGDELEIEASQGVLTKSLIADIQANKAELLTLVKLRETERYCGDRDEDDIVRLRSRWEDGTLEKLDVPIPYRPGHTISPGRLVDAVQYFFADLDHGRECRRAAGHLKDIALAVDRVLDDRRTLAIARLEEIRDELAGRIIAEEERLSALPRDDPVRVKGEQRWQLTIREYEATEELLRGLNHQPWNREKVEAAVEARVRGEFGAG